MRGRRGLPPAAWYSRSWQPGQWPPRSDAAAELAFYFAFVRHDPAQAKGYLADAERPLTEAHRRLRARAAVLLRACDKAGATRAVQEARVAVAKPTLEATALDRDLITAVGAEVGAMGPLGATVSVEGGPTTG